MNDDALFHVNGGPRADRWKHDELPSVGDNSAVRVRAKSLGSLVRGAPDGEDALLGSNGYLRRGGGLLWVGPTGVGKSSAGLQAAIQWARGRNFFGIPAIRPLRSLIVQAENDDEDMAEIRDGVFDGLELTADEREHIGEMIYCHQDNEHSGAEFFSKTVEPLLQEHRPDLLWIDPALSYIAGESNSQADVGRFLRNWLNPLLARHKCAVIVTHHTNKPPTGKEKNEWSGSDLAYLGSGSAEWANWARAVIAIRGLGSNEVFELCLGKRGGRVGLRNEAGEPIYSTLIGHAKEPGRIYWRNADESERPGSEKKTGRREVFSADNLLQILGKGSKSFGDWWADAEAQQWSKATFKRRLAELVQDKHIEQSKLDGTYARKINR